MWIIFVLLTFVLPVIGFQICLAGARTSPLSTLGITLFVLGVTWGPIYLITTLIYRLFSRK